MRENRGVYTLQIKSKTVYLHCHCRDYGRSRLAFFCLCMMFSIKGGHHMQAICSLQSNVHRVPYGVSYGLWVSLLAQTWMPFINKFSHHLPPCKCLFYHYNKPSQFILNLNLHRCEEPLPPQIVVSSTSAFNLHSY